jgi:lysophospholipase L1-like esterase
MGNKRFVTIENRIFNGNEGRTTVTGGVGWFTRTLHTVGSAKLKNINLVTDGYIKPAGSPETDLPNAYTIDEIYVEVVGKTPVQILWGGAASKTINPGDSNITSDQRLANELNSALSLLPIGTEFWVKAIGTVPTVAAATRMPTCVRNIADATGTRFGWYNPANTTIVNGPSVAGDFTWTGTAPDLRTSGWAPQIIGEFEDGKDAVVTFASGDSITQGLQDATPKRTGRGWYQYVLYGDGSNSESTGIRAGYNAGVSGDTAASQKGMTKTMSKMQWCTDIFSLCGTNDIGQAGGGNTAAQVHADRLAIATSLKAQYVGTRTPKVIFCELQPQSTSGNPTKTINSAPNTGWGVGEKSDQTNALAIAAVGSGVDYYAATPSIRQSTDKLTAENFTWKYTGGTNAFDTTYTPDGQHPGNVGVVAWAADVNPVYRQIQGGTVVVSASGKIGGRGVSIKGMAKKTISKKAVTG